MNKLFLFVVVHLCCVSVFASFDLPPGERPVKLNTAMYIVDIDSINTSEQSYAGRVFILIKWRDRRLAHKGSSPLVKSLKEIWHPMVQILHQRKVWKTTPDTVTIMPNGEVIYKQALWGVFSQQLKLQAFPFDTQEISLELVSGSGYTPDKLQFEPNAQGISGISDNLSVADWEISNWHESTEPFVMKNFEERPAIRFSFTAKRLTSYYVVKMILPLVMIVMMSWAVFWMDPLNVASNVGISITSMLTLIAYRFSADTILPRLSYLTSLDYFILASTILVFLSLVQNLTTSSLVKRNKLLYARRLDVSCRFGFPLIFIIIILETMVFRWAL